MRLGSFTTRQAVEQLVFSQKHQSTCHPERSKGSQRVPSQHVGRYD